MPRAKKRAPQTPQQGTYPQRSDLRAKQPIRTAPGQQYGMQTQQANAQKVAPLPQGNAQIPTSPTGPPPSAGMLGGGPPVTPLTAPTQRPGEPLTTGIPSGPGAGPEALTPRNNPVVQVAAVLNQLGDQADPDTKRLRDQLNASITNAGLP